ncbi:MAG: LysR substrate-binding domain-containing protein [Pigmentiphaga sp.]|uniref:LysR substrate-binding domain-containing protein n=1 Tax=Pigmentiphaga sp. TaxID=1977564 RepID=UPI0029AF4049|nr:LysR substrate-binding domain-containing protein [Pigmentiphaga sp.]MDX3904834.1 LysR substrate-binding domain-containing protein [Pigmentiphaga sp.]
MDLKQLEYFVRVAELGGFTRASIALNIAQPALSRQVRQLEIELGQSLLRRNGRGVVPTEAGKVLLEHGRGILHQIARTREELGRVRGVLAGRVAIGLPPRFAKMLTVPLTRAVRQRLPEAALSISENLSTSLQESLVSGRLDIALLYNPVPSPDVDSVVLLEEDFYLVTRRGPGPARKSISVRELADEPLVIPTRPNTIRMLVESELADIGRHPTIAMEIDGIAAILDLVAEGVGAAVLSVNAVRTSGRDEVFHAIPIVKPRLRSKLALAVSAQRPATRTQQAMQQIIRELVLGLDM